LAHFNLIMARFQEKPVFVEAITFEELVAHGLKYRGAPVVEGQPLAFMYNGEVITRDDQKGEDSYTIHRHRGYTKIRRGDFLITEKSGIMHVKNADMFHRKYQALK
jgi:hypothetical protein